MKKLSMILLFVCFISSNFYPQVGVKLSSLPPYEVSEYMKPAATWFGAYFNSGTYYDADVDETFGFKFSLVGMWTIIPEDQKTFETNPQVGPTATVFGNKSSYYLGSNGFYTYPSGLSLNAVPMGIYQFSGSLYNTELMLRFFPKIKFGDVETGIFGFGIKHEISSHIPLLPVHIAVQILYNKFDIEYVGDDPTNYTKINSSNFAFNIHASKIFTGMFIVYSGLQYESSTMDLGYYFEDENNYYPELGNQVQNLSIDGDNSIRFTLGGAVKLGFFVVNADVNLTKFTTFTTGLSFDF